MERQIIEWIDGYATALMNINSISVEDAIRQAIDAGNSRWMAPITRKIYIKICDDLLN